MQLKDIFHTFCIVIVTSLILIGCIQKSKPLRVAAHKWPGYEFMFLAQREGWLDNKSIHINETQSATESLSALASGEVDAVALTLDEVLRARDSGIPLQVVLVFDESAGADALITKNELSQLSELKGKRIGVEKTAVGALMLSKVLLKAKLNESDVTLVDSSIDQHLQDWNANNFDAVITYEPVSTQLEQQGGHRLIDSRSITGVIFDVLAVRSDVAGQYAKELKELVGAHFKALQHMQRNPQDAAYRMADHLELSGNKVLSVFRGLELPNISVNTHYLSEGDKITIAARELSTEMLNLKLIEKPDTLQGLVTQKYLSIEE